MADTEVLAVAGSWIAAMLRSSTPLMMVTLGETLTQRVGIVNLGIEAGSATGKLVLSALGGIAEFEREMLLERQRKGIRRAQAEGRYNRQGESRPLPAGSRRGDAASGSGSEPGREDVTPSARTDLFVFDSSSSDARRRGRSREAPRMAAWPAESLLHDRSYPKTRN